MPLWALSFEQKLPLVPTEKFETLISKEETLIALDAPREVQSISIEREMVSDHNDRKWLVERVYFRFLSTEPTLAGVTTLTAAIDSGLSRVMGFHCTFQSPELSEQGVWQSFQPEIASLETVFRSEFPIISSL